MICVLSVPEPKYFSFTTNSENVASAAVSSYSGVKRKKDSDQIQNVQRQCNIGHNKMNRYLE